MYNRRRYHTFGGGDACDIKKTTLPKLENFISQILRKVVVMGEPYIRYNMERRAVCGVVQKNSRRLPDRATHAFRK